MRVLNTSAFEGTASLYAKGALHTIIAKWQLAAMFRPSHARHSSDALRSRVRAWRAKPARWQAALIANSSGDSVVALTGVIETCSSGKSMLSLG